MNKYTGTLAASILLVLIAPILIAQLTGSTGRDFRAARLQDAQYLEIHFDNREQNLSLGGLLFLPAGDGPFPAAVIIHGSGTSNRGNRWYLTLTHYLQENGVLVLLPDKRGSEASQGDWRGASFGDLATDTRAAIRFLRDQDRVPVSHIGVVGMSQGGWIAPIVASDSPDIAFVVNVVGAAVTTHEQLLYEEDHNLRQAGLVPGVSKLVAHLSASHIRNVGQKQFWDAVGDFDPLPYWRRLTVPSLVLYGDRDTNVPSAESATRLRSLMNPNIDVRVYEGSGHALEDPEGQGNSIFRSDALEQIRDLILSVGPASR